MTAKVSFKDNHWEREPIVVVPEEHVIFKNEEYTIVEYVVKVATVRCYYNNEKCKSEVMKNEQDFFF